MNMIGIRKDIRTSSRYFFYLSNLLLIVEFPLWTEYRGDEPDILISNQELTF